jgi:superoxide dismutase, Fe-Mn family
MFKLPDLPYAYEALEPTISANTLHFHHDKHHAAYVNALNGLLPEGDKRPLEAVIREAGPGKVFNNAAQAWNHDFYWHSLSPKAAAPSVTLRRQLERDFGSYESFVERLATAATGQFGSGWAWLVQKDGKLEVMATPNAQTPMAQGIRCLLTLDVWEHAYYIDYRNQRERYVQALIEQRLNWEFAEKNLESR